MPNSSVGTHYVPLQVWKYLWNFKLPHKIILFVYKCIKDIVPTRGKLSRYKSGIELYCSLGNHPSESINHLLIECSYVRSMWLALNIYVGNILAQRGSFIAWVISRFSVRNNLNFGTGISWHDINKLFIVSVWTIWKRYALKDFSESKP